VAGLSVLPGLFGRRDELLDRFSAAIAVERGRRSGSAETRVALDLLHPDLARSPAQESQAARWRLRTARRRLFGARFSRDVLAAFHGADAQKGRRLTVSDLRTRTALRR